MRLLLTADTVGGVWTFACELTAELLRRGHDVLLVTLGQAPSAAQSAQATRLGELGCFHSVASNAGLEWMPENRDAYAAAAPLLLNLTETFRPDALVLSQFCFGALPVSVPKLLIAHSDVLSWAEAVGKAPLAEDTWLHTYRSLVQSGLNGAQMLVAPTAAMLEDLARGFDVVCPTRIVPNGRSLAPQAGIPTRKLQAVTAGRIWDPAKNLELLLTVKLPLPVIVAGDNSSGTAGNEDVTLIGPLDINSLLALLRESTMYICCSRYEPFGLAPLEAALCGCAVLAYDIASLREVWDQGALYFRDADSLAALLQTLIAEPSLLETAQTRSAARAQRYKSNTMADGYLDALAALIASHSEAQFAA